MLWPLPAGTLSLDDSTYRWNKVALMACYLCCLAGTVAEI